jgi:RecA-family ATPase
MCKNFLQVTAMLNPDFKMLTLDDFANLPEKILQAKRYVLWRSVMIENSGKPRKIPCYCDGSPRFGHLDTPEDIAKLATLEQAIEAFNLCVYVKPCTGLGFAMGPDGSGFYFQGIDLDDIAAHPALEFIGEKLFTYCERSPSKKGCHYIGFGRAFRSLGANGTGIEAYSAGRYFTLTGDALNHHDLIDLADFVEGTLLPLHSPGKQASESLQPVTQVTDHTLRDLRLALFATSADSYTHWVAMGLALKTIGAPGQDLWLEWSATSDKFDADQAETKWNGFQPTATGFGAVFAEAQRQGWQNPRAPAVKIGSSSAIVQNPKSDPLADALRLVPATPREVDIARLTPRVIVPGFLFADVRVRVAAGGTGKTTLALYEAMRLALARPLWGFQPEQPGRSVFITREDARENLVARLREICRAECLTPQDTATVFERVVILDLSGVHFRLSAVVEDVVVPWTAYVNALIDACASFEPSWVIFDPAVSFGTGEMRVNDSEQGLIEACRMIRNALNACVELIHHTGKANARDKAVDQYAGRGGSSMADGSRMLTVLVPLDEKEWQDATGYELGADQTGFKMVLAKMSFCRPPEPIYVVREGFRFEQVNASKVSPEAQREMEAQQVLQFLRNELQEGRRYSKRSLQESAAVMNLTRNSVRAALAWLEARALVDVDRDWKNQWLNPVKGKQ